MNPIKTVTHNLPITLVGNILGAAIGFITLLLVTRNLTVHDFGIFNTALAFILIVTQLSSFGFNLTMVKQSSFFLAKNEKINAAQIIKIATILKSLSSLTFGIIILLFSEQLAANMFGSLEMAFLINLSAATILSYSMLDFFKYACFSYQEFKKAVFIQISVDCFRLFLIGLFISLSTLNLSYTIFAYLIAPLAGIGIGLSIIFPKIRSLPSVPMELISTFLSFSKWIFLGSIVRVIIPYVGIFMITKMISAKASGIYGLALNLTYIFPILIASLNSVLLPEISRLKEASEVKNYLIFCMKFPFYLTILAILLILISPFFINLFFGDKYAEAIPIFNWLLGGFLISAGNNAFFAAFYALDKPWIVSLVYFFQLLIITIGTYKLILLFGVITPAILFFVVNLATLLFLAGYTLKNYILISGKRALSKG